MKHPTRATPSLSSAQLERRVIPQSRRCPDLGTFDAQLRSLTLKPMTANHLSLIDVQSQAPSLALSLSRVGVTGVEKVIRIRQNGSEQLFSARFECVVELGPNQKGAHMSRFEEVVNEAIGEVVLNETTFKAETLAEHIAQLVRSRQGARRAEVNVEARFPEHKPAPVSGIQTQELYTLHGSAISSERGTRRLIGVTAQGMTACPCAQELVAGAARERLQSRGLRRRRDRQDPRRGAGRDPQPARSRNSAYRLHRAAAMTRSTPPRCSRSWRVRCPRRSTS